MASDEIYRADCARRHKMLGCYLVLWCWTKKIDCVVIERKTLFEYLNVERMHRSRALWLQEDLEHFFPHAQTMYFSSGRTFATMYLSRSIFPRGFPWSTQPTNSRVSRLNDFGLKTKIITLPKEETLITRLMTTVNGLRNFPLK